MAKAEYLARSGARFPLETPRWRDDDGAPLMITPLAGVTKDDLDASARGLWRYQAALPTPIAQPISMGEGRTPLVERAFARGRALCKLDWMTPTGSFKDRGVSVMLSTLRQHGVFEVLEDSSGNGGASVAAYAAFGGLRAKILAPAYAQAEKIVQMRACGAEVELVDGSRDDVAREAVRQSDEIFYASHNWQPFFLHGVKTAAYEIWEDLGHAAPDNIIVSTGAGSNILGADLAFGELARAGAARKTPRLFAAQPRNCAPIVSNLDHENGPFKTISAAPTIAEGASIAHPERLPEVLAALRRSGGGACAIEEDAIVRAHGALCASGLYVEPTCAMALAAFERLLEARVIQERETTVLILTGSGLKATGKIGAIHEFG